MSLRIFWTDAAVLREECSYLKNELYPISSIDSGDSADSLALSDIKFKQDHQIVIFQMISLIIVLVFGFSLIAKTNKFLVIAPIIVALIQIGELPLKPVYP